MENVINYYQNYNEDARLTTDKARHTEFITTTNVLDSYINDNTKLLDVAAGTGIYLFNYAGKFKNIEITAFDLAPKHIDIINGRMADTGFNIKTKVNDARDLSAIKNETFDVVLCMGPLYHLQEQNDREKCLNECHRVLKKGGILAVAYISSFCIFPFVITADKRFINDKLINQMLDDGFIPSGDSNYFWTDTYYFKPCEIERFVENNGFEMVDHVATDSISTTYLKDCVNQMSADEYNVWIKYHLSTCREKSVLGISNHGLIIARKV